MATSPPSGRRVLWDGPLFGRLTKPGRTWLLERGWNRLSSPPPSLDDNTIIEEEPLAFIWPSKSGPQFPTSTIAPALVRPFPTNITECVDDKLCLAQLLEPYQIMPQHYHTVEDAINDNDTTLYFVKHRYGAQGKSVYVHDKSSLEKWSNSSCTNMQDFVIQEEVSPALDNLGRKFVLRGHVLLYKKRQQTHAGLHRNVICCPHALPYEPSAAASKSVHISQAGKNHPPPCLISKLSENHAAASAFPAIQECTRTLLEATIPLMMNQDTTIAPGVTCFALLGTDYLVSDLGDIKLCEVNSHPALGWGSMAQVSKPVFAQLIQETLDIVLFDAPMSSTGFVPIMMDIE